MSSSAHFPDSDSFQRQSDEFITWLAGNPGVRINSKISIADLRSKSAGRGVVARSDIFDGEELFSIPRGLVLSAQNSKLKDLLSHDLEELGPWLSLILVMMYEYLLGEQSAWAPYFKVLPKSFDTLMFWSPSELQELQGSAIVSKIGKEGAEDSIMQMIAPVVRANTSLFPPVEGLASWDGEAGSQALLGLAHIMGSLIMAYAFDIEKVEDEDDEDNDEEDGYVTDDEQDQSSKGMVPLADILNADADRNNARLFQEEDSLVMKAIKPIQAGDEIFNDYGELPRADLLRRYGYVTDNYAPYDVVELSLDQICRSAGLQSADIESQPPLAFLEDLELLDDGYVVPRPSPENSLLTDILPDELLLLLKTLTLSPEQLEHQKSKSKPPKPSFGHAEAAILLKTIQLLGSQYPTTIAQDEEVLSRLIQSEASQPLNQSDRRQKMAIQVRLGEKYILQTLADILDEVITKSAQSNGGSSLKRSANGDCGDSRKTKAPRN
ncbi:ribosomal N-lysine methyltransferase 4 [Aspergillus udagawae]|uniref:Ribosomal N-lysine methyltransferase 4 n=1 Tax=Aspergillus udagawae TaxID=91492 RepID=A0ABQ1B854_9EURO|nr:ribosomal N-lysine methyltransferase 4 [Aspergillus udagawae]GFF35717.1 ribosomal N-lysine methyltransferase 4 [Aspergillus udagawae]GFF95831.1 ribosomal N-lysine methyltransferase 4 [Aspergillus udagawae]GFG15264.1 ribosomal N-lysine methyltransferase 4 [Aspergillus udagawae]